MKILICIPAYNESNLIKDIIIRSKKYGDVIVIDDCSKDGTGEISKKSGAFVLRNMNNLGYEASLNIGYKYFCDKKKYDCFITIDADGQHDPDDIKKFISIYKKSSVDIICGSRKFFNRKTEYLFSFFSKHITKINDPLCGLKLYSRNINEISKSFDSENLIGTELLYKAYKKNFKIINVIIKTKKRIDGESRYASSFIGNLKILRCLFFFFKRVAL